jgi:hypothetical protein
MHAPQPAGIDPALNRSRAQPERDQLAMRNDPVLILGDPRDFVVDSSSVATDPTPLPPGGRFGRRYSSSKPTTPGGGGMVAGICARNVL